VIKAKQHKQAMLLLQAKGKTNPRGRTSSLKSPVNHLLNGKQIKQQQSLPTPQPRFHLSSFRRKTSFCDSWYNPAKEMDYSSQAMTEGLMSSKLHNWSHEDRHYSFGNEGDGIAKSLRMRNVSLEVTEEDERQRRLAQLHKQREEEMEVERQKRLQYIEEVIIPPHLPSPIPTSPPDSFCCLLTPLTAKKTS
jgi:hypothetical protein